MTKRKFKKGRPVTCLDDLKRGIWFVYTGVRDPRGKTVHVEVIRSLQLRHVERLISSRWLYFAEPVT